MPTARTRSTEALQTAPPMPAAYPPLLRSLSDPRPHPNPAKVPASTRYASGRTLQDDLDDLDADEDAHYTQVSRFIRLIALSKRLTLTPDATGVRSPPVRPCLARAPRSPKNPRRGRRREALLHACQSIPELTPYPLLFPQSMLNSSPNAGAHEPDGSFSPPPNIGAGAGDALPRPVPLNLDEPAAAARRHGARRPTGGRRAFEPEDSDGDEEEAAVDLDAEIEDADATRGSSADEDSVGARRGGADDSGEASMDM